MGDVAINVHGGGLAVFRDVFVILWAGLIVHGVDTGDRHIFIATGYVPGEWAETRDVKACVGSTVVFTRDL